MEHSEKKIYFAPMEGVTGFVYRNLYNEMFPGVDRFYTPFLSANHTHSFRSKEGKDIDPENNRVPDLVPQLLTNSAEDFVWALGRLSSYGYKEVNLNLGCPSSTVTAKKKGAGFLSVPDELDRFFERVFTLLENEDLPVRISVKTRLGIHSPEEAPALMRIYNRYPVCELIIHARIRDDMYKGSPRLEAFSACLEESVHPVCYNGDIFSTGDYCRINERFPGLSAVMIGRGLIADPSLICRLRNRTDDADRSGLLDFHDRLFESYCENMSSQDAVFHMKEVWFYLAWSFPENEKEIRKILKSKNDREYTAAVSVFRQSIFCHPRNYR